MLAIFQLWSFSLSLVVLGTSLLVLGELILYPYPYKRGIATNIWFSPVQYNRFHCIYWSIIISYFLFSFHQLKYKHKLGHLILSKVNSDLKHCPVWWFPGIIFVLIEETVFASDWWRPLARKLLVYGAKCTIGVNHLFFKKDLIFIFFLDHSKGNFFPGIIGFFVFMCYTSLSQVHGQEDFSAKNKVFVEMEHLSIQPQMIEGLDKHSWAC